jgi:hypothetical protein
VYRPLEKVVYIGGQMASWNSDICKALNTLEVAPPGIVPMYDEASVDKTQKLVDDIRRVAEQADDDSARQILLNQYADRLGEGIELYKRARLLRIMERQFLMRGALEPPTALAPEEVTFLNAYRRAIARFRADQKIDPMAPFDPPKSLITSMEAVRETGMIGVSDFCISLYPHDVLTLRRTEAQTLAGWGYVQILKDLE